jgi:uncharacterized protein with NRDE domain
VGRSGADSAAHVSRCAVVVVPGIFDGYPLTHSRVAQGMFHVKRFRCSESLAQGCMVISNWK